MNELGEPPTARRNGAVYICSARQSNAAKTSSINATLIATPAMPFAITAAVRDDGVTPVVRNRPARGSGCIQGESSTCC
jgi:hypothetical protein